MEVLYRRLWLDSLKDFISTRTEIKVSIEKDKIDNKYAYVFLLAISLISVCFFLISLYCKPKHVQKRVNLPKQYPVLSTVNCCKKYVR